uniref:Uncharacterized protein n=1 Tax=Rhizophora mucronata TaxID=61149 RepID=A0A2P2IZJ4_RHIMU
MSLMRPFCVHNDQHLFATQQGSILYLLLYDLERILIMEAEYFVVFE